MEWSDSQGLSSDDRGAASTVGGVDTTISQRVDELPQWLKTARINALQKGVKCEAEAQGRSA